MLLEALEDRRVEHAADLYRGRFLHGVYVRGLSGELEEWMLATADDVSRRVQRALISDGEAIAAERRYRVAAAKAEAAYEIGIHLVQPEDLIRLHTLLQAGDSVLSGVVANEAALLDVDLAQGEAEARARLDAAASRSHPTNLHAPATSFVGRARELAELDRLLARQDHRLITLVGPGGIGKSRLAVQVASQPRTKALFPDGSFFVALEDATTAEEIPARIADAVGVFQPADVDPLTGLTASLGQRRLLVVLDNCEHLPDAAFVAARLVRDCPHLNVLATSLDPLAIEEEWLFPVKGMAGPTGHEASSGGIQSEAVELFQTRAQRTQPSFRVQTADLPGIAAICRLTGGSPLALELAAARLGVRSVAEIAAEIQTNLDFLEATSRNALDRHRSLRVVFEHAWRSLNESERDCLARLSVFRGGFRRAAAREVADASYAVLASLVNRSLIVQGARHRYESHPLILQYTSEKLAAEPDRLAHTEARYAAYMLDLATEAQQQLNGPDGGVWLERLEVDHANARRALAWAEREGRFELLVDLTNALADFWIRRGHLREALGWFAKVAAAGEGIRKSPEIDRRYARALQQYSFICLSSGDFDTPVTLLTESLDIHLRLGHAGEVAQARSHLGIAAVFRGDYVGARQQYEDALEIAVAAGGTYEIARLLNNLGDVSLLEGDASTARRYYEESLALERALSDRQMVSNVLGSLGVVALIEGDFAQARVALKESLELVQALGITFSVPTAFEQVASLATATERPLAAARLWGAAESLREEIRTPIASFARPARDSWIACAQGRCDARAFETAWQEGRSLSQQSAFELAFELL